MCYFCCFCPAPEPVHRWWHIPHNVFQPSILRQVVARFSGLGHTALPVAGLIYMQCFQRLVGEYQNICFSGNRGAGCFEAPTDGTIAASACNSPGLNQIWESFSFASLRQAAFYLPPLLRCRKKNKKSMAMHGSLRLMFGTIQPMKLQFLETALGVRFSFKPLSA